jgi:hypothetical protein
VRWSVRSILPGRFSRRALAARADFFGAICCAALVGFSFFCSDPRLVPVPARFSSLCAGVAQAVLSSRFLLRQIPVCSSLICASLLICAGQDWVAARSVVNAGQSASVPAPQPLCAGQSGRFRFEVFVTAPRILFFAVVFRRSSSFRC